MVLLTKLSVAYCFNCTIVHLNLTVVISDDGLSCVCSAFPSAGYQSYGQHPGMMYYGGVPPMVPSFVPGFTPYGAEQLQWMQQAYAQSMMHYMQQ